MQTTTSNHTLNKSQRNSKTKIKNLKTHKNNAKYKPPTKAINAVRAWDFDVLIIGTRCFDYQDLMF